MYEVYTTATYKVYTTATVDDDEPYLFESLEAALTYARECSTGAPLRSYLVYDGFTLIAEYYLGSQICE